MKIRISLLSLGFLLLSLNLLIAQQPAGKDPWQKWNSLLGKWKADNQGDPAKGEGSFTFAPDLDNSVMIRKNILVFPATLGKPGMKHEDLMVVYPGKTESEFRAEYWDNEAHVIHYSISFSPEGNTIFVSDILPGQPRFRLTYILVDKTHLNVRFDIASPASPEAFNTYIEGKAVKEGN
jgi:hypothetical protein